MQFPDLYVLLVATRTLALTSVSFIIQYYSIIYQDLEIYQVLVLSPSHIESSRCLSTWFLYLIPPEYKVKLAENVRWDDETLTR